MAEGGSPSENLNERTLLGSLWFRRQETEQVCHAFLQDPKFFQLLHRIDRELAGEAKAVGCACGGVLYRADYPRKLRGCPPAVRRDYETRFSFCCGCCRL